MAILLNKEKVIETSAYYKLKVMYLFHRSSLLHSEYLIHNTLKTEAHKNCLNLKTHVTNSVSMVHPSFHHIKRNTSLFLPCRIPVYLLSTHTPLRGINIKFLPTVKHLNQTSRSWEYRKWSQTQEALLTLYLTTVNCDPLHFIFFDEVFKCKFQMFFFISIFILFTLA